MDTELFLLRNAAIEIGAQALYVANVNPSVVPPVAVAIIALERELARPKAARRRVGLVVVVRVRRITAAPTCVTNGP